MITERIPPSNQEAEEAVIGSVLLLGEVKIELGTSDFYFERNGWFWDAFMKLKEGGTSINQVTVAHELSGMGKLEDVGGAAFISHLIASTPTPYDLEYYADIVRKLSAKRKLIRAGENIVSMGYDQSADVQKVLDKADEEILDLKKQSGKLEIITPKDRVMRLNERYENLMKHEGGVALSTGLRDLDRAWGGGMFKGDYIVVAGRPGMGKTTLEQQVGNYAAQFGKTLLCTGEMGSDDLGDRDMARLLNVPVSTIRCGGYSADFYASILEIGLSYIEKLNVYHYQASRGNPFTIKKIYQVACKMQERHGLTLLVIDYLGMLRDEYGNNGNERIGYISREIKSIARDLDIPVIVGVQLSRKPELRVEKEPQLSDLRDSGNIEQDADIVTMLYREDYYKKQQKAGLTKIIISKNRQGAIGFIEVYYDGHEYRDTVKEAYGN